jgi:hypothetical protein
MLRFKQYIEILTEAVKKATEKKKKVKQNTQGVLHELLVGYHLNGGQHMEHHTDKEGLTPTQAHDKLKASITPEEYDAINDRAKKAAEHLKSIVETNGHKIHKVNWTSKNGDIERSTGIKSTQSEDASDLVITTRDSTGNVKHHGVSLKVSSLRRSSHVPLSNRGIEATYGGDRIANAHRSRVLSTYPELKNLPNDPNYKENGADDKRRRWAQANPKKAADIKVMNTAALHSVAQHLTDHLNNSGPAAIVDHLRNHVLYAKKTPMQRQGHAHIRHTTYGDGTMEHYDPSEHFEHILSEPEHITVERSGTGVVFSHRGVPFARHSLKFNSQSDPVSSIKGVGNTTGSKKKKK